MITTQDKELNEVLATLTDQRNAAFDQVALLSARLRMAENLTAELQKQLEAAKPKEGEA